MSIDSMLPNMTVFKKDISTHPPRLVEIRIKRIDLVGGRALAEIDGKTSWHYRGDWKYWRKEQPVLQ